jgi:hypothetical protein
MMMIIPMFESPSMNGEVSTGRIPMLTISDPKARKYRTDVRLVRFARNDDTKTPNQIMARCSRSSIVASTAALHSTCGTEAVFRYRLQVRLNQ